jgi:hypothetical protein
MSSSSDFELIHGQLHCTKDESKPELLGRGPCSIRGSQYSQCPAVFGNDKTFEATEGTVMIGPLNNTDAPFPIVCGGLKFIPTWRVNPCGITGIGMDKGRDLLNPYSLVVRKGPAIVDSPLSCAPRCEGPKKGPAAALFVGDVDFYENVRIKERLSVVQKADFKQDVIVGRRIITGNDIIARGNITAQGEVKSQCGGHVLSAKKNFDIPHPTKEGWRLTHTCVEGPEAAVYIRGRVKNKNEISLPEYWRGLVDINTVTVNLTPIGAHQDVIIKRWNDEKVYLQSKGGMPIDCFYYIMAERIDTEKLIPEYQGTISDYPGDNTQRSIAGYHYDVKE